MAKQKLVGIYKLTSPDGKIYIGQSRDLTRRYGAFFNSVESSFINNYPNLLNATQKYPRELWRHEVICYCNINELDELEKLWIDNLDATNPNKGYNLAKGGKGILGVRYVCPESRKEKVRRAITGIKRSDETKRKMSEARTIGVDQYSLEGVFIRAWSGGAKEAAGVLGISYYGINKCCNGKNKQCGGYIWRHADY